MSSAKIQNRLKVLSLAYNSRYGYILISMFQSKLHDNQATYTLRLKYITDPIHFVSIAALCCHIYMVIQ